MVNATLGERLPPFTRVTDFANWNRYAAVNDEFIDVHMSADAAREAGQPDVFGMGNLRIAYAHAMLHSWLTGRGDIASFSCQFRGLNFRGDVLNVHGTTTAATTASEPLLGATLVDIELGVTNGEGVETMPGFAQVILFGDGPARMPPPPSQPPIPEPRPGLYLDDDTISWLGRPLPSLRSMPVDANDVRRWAQATWYPELPPRDLVDDDIARATAPWHGLVAPRDFNPYAWNPDHRPDVYPWMRGMGTEPGRRGLNGGQRCWHGAPIRVGDTITCVVTLIDAFEKVGKLGTMLFLVDESRWTNQHGDTVRVGQRTSIYH